ncbi:MAG: hypothetical protein CNLJKLNK_00308 [Holosporales bacterium]
MKNLFIGITKLFLSALLFGIFSDVCIATLASDQHSNDVCMPAVATDQHSNDVCIATLASDQHSNDVCVPAVATDQHSNVAVLDAMYKLREAEEEFIIAATSWPAYMSYKRFYQCCTDIKDKEEYVRYSIIGQALRFPELAFSNIERSPSSCSLYSMQALIILASITAAPFLVPIAGISSCYDASDKKYEVWRNKLNRLIMFQNQEIIVIETSPGQIFLVNIFENNFKVFATARIKDYIIAKYFTPSNISLPFTSPSME